MGNFRDLDRMFGLLKVVGDVQAPQNSQILAASGTRRIVIDQFIISADGPCIVRLEDSNGNLVLPSLFPTFNQSMTLEPYSKVGNGLSLNLAVSGLGLVSYFLLYHLEGV